MRILINFMKSVESVHIIKMKGLHALYVFRYNSTIFFNVYMDCMDNKTQQLSLGIDNCKHYKIPRSFICNIAQFSYSVLEKFTENSDE